MTHKEQRQHLDNTAKTGGFEELVQKAFNISYTKYSTSVLVDLNSQNIRELQRIQKELDLPEGPTIESNGFVNLKIHVATDYKDTYRIEITAA